MSMCGNRMHTDLSYEPPGSGSCVIMHSGSFRFACAQGPPSLGLGSTQTQGLSTDSGLGLTHNQAAQKASEEGLRNNGARLFPEECVPDSPKF